MVLGPRLPPRFEVPQFATCPNCQCPALPSPHSGSRLSLTLLCQAEGEIAPCSIPAPSPFQEALNCVATCRCQLPRPSSLRLKGVASPGASQGHRQHRGSRELSLAAVREVGIRVLILPFWSSVAHSASVCTVKWERPDFLALKQVLRAFSRPGEGAGRTPEEPLRPPVSQTPARPTPTMTAHILLLFLVASSILGDPDSAGR